MKILYHNYKGSGYSIGEKTQEYVIVRLGGQYDQHGHIRKSQKKGKKNRDKGLTACITVINAIGKNELAKSRFLRGCQARLLSADEFSKLKYKKAKDKFININKGVRRI